MAIFLLNFTKFTLSLLAKDTIVELGVEHCKYCNNIYFFGFITFINNLYLIENHGRFIIVINNVWQNICIVLTYKIV